MSDNFLAAVLIALNPDRASSALLLQQALQYVEQIQTSADGWRLCLDSFLSLSASSSAPEVRFFCLQQLISVVKTRYPEWQAEQRSFLCQSIMTFVRDHLSYQNATAANNNLNVFSSSSCPTSLASSAKSANSFLRNKLAELITAIFINDYPQSWPSFFTDFISMLQQQPSKELLFLFVKILHTIDSEVVALDSRRPSDRVARCLLIKDAMRAQDMPLIIDTLMHIMTAFSFVSSNASSSSGLNSSSSATTVATTNAEDIKLTNMALSTLREFIGWIDINLVANNRTMAFLYACITNSTCFRREACYCVQEMVEKKMTDKEKKVLLIAQFQMVEMINSVAWTRNDEDLATDMATLLLAVGTQLIDACPFTSTVSSSTSNSKNLSATLSSASSNLLTPSTLLKCQEELELAMSVAYRFFEFCSAQVLYQTELVDFLRMYARSIHASPVINEQQVQHVKRMFKAINEGILFPSEYNLQEMDEFERNFMDLRSQLHHLFATLVPAMPDLCVELVVNNCQTVLSSWRSQPFNRIEAALQLLYDLGGTLKGGLSTRMNSEPLRSLIGAVFTSDVIMHEQQEIALHYYNIVYRYVKFFDGQAQVLGNVLCKFVGDYGLSHPHVKVRGRVCYLLYKVLATINDVLRRQLQPFLDAMLQPMQRIIESAIFYGITIEAEASSVTQNGAIAASTPFSSRAVAIEDAQYLCESLGILVSSQITGEMCVQYVTAVLAFFHTHLTAALNSASTWSNSPENEEMAGNRLAAMVEGFGNLSKALSKDSARVRSLFDSVLMASFQVFNGLPKHEAVRSAIIFVIHRMIECQGELVIPHLPPVLSQLIAHSHEKNMPNLLPLITQLILQFKSSFASTLDPLLIPLFAKVNQCLSVYAHTLHTVNASTVASDSIDSDSVAYSTDRQERVHLEHRFYSFLRLLLLEIPQVLLSSTNSIQAWPVIDSLVTGLRSTDTGIAKACAQCLHSLLKHMQSIGMLSEVKAQQWLKTELIIKSMTAIISPAFNLEDANSISALREIVALHRWILQLFGNENEYAQCLITVDGLNSSFVQSFASALQANDFKSIIAAIKVLRGPNAKSLSLSNHSLSMKIRVEATDTSPVRGASRASSVSSSSQASPKSFGISRSSSPSL